MSRAPKPHGDDAAPLYLSFANNALLGALYGEHDRYLARIEQALGVSLASRGNQLAITGRPEATEKAKRAMLGLYDVLEKGLPVTAQDVDAALRMVVADEPAGNGDGVARLVADDTVITTQRRRIIPRSPAQVAYVRALQESELVFGIGPAGTGKTYLAVAVAVAMLTHGQVDRIILSRPAVEAGERLGFLPGDLREKVDPYLRPMYDALYDMMPSDRVMDRLQSGVIEIAPLAFMRGRTLSNAYVILDEAQNTSPVQMKMFLTRLGEKSRMAVTGDLSQVDLPTGTRPGLSEALAVVGEVEGVSVVRFSHADVVRHRLVTALVRAYEVREREVKEP
ncbi:MAG: PhoH family protein [Alphaproteobacteria bacterium]|nr:PhoH family protein [Alphaproteobacteria bacterium]